MLNWHIENTCSEWMIAALGAFGRSVIVTTIYTTLGMDAVVSIVQDGETSDIVCNKKIVRRILLEADNMKSLKMDV